MTTRENIDTYFVFAIQDLCSKSYNILVFFSKLMIGLVYNIVH
jgi:hypothetical protein